MSLSATTSVFFVGGKNKGGRPRVSAEPLERINVRIPSTEYNKIIALALERGESVSTITRSLLKIRVAREFRRQKPSD